MSPVRGTSGRVIFAYGAGFIAFGWALHALAAFFPATIETGFLKIGVVVAGVLAGLIGIVRALAWRPQRLERQYQLNHSILADAAHSIISTDSNGTVETFSSGAERLLGYRANEVIGVLKCDVFHEASELVQRAAELSVELGRTITPGFAALSAKAGTDGPAEEREWTYIRQDGTRVPVRVSMTTMRNRRGTITGFLAIASDVTQQRRAEERRRELDARLSRIATQVPGMVYQFKQFPDGRRCFPFASQGIRQILRLEPEAVLEDASAIWSVIHPEDVERVARSIDQSAESL